MRQMGGLSREDPDHLRDDAHRLAGDRRHPAAGRLLLEGRDPRRIAQARLRCGSGLIGFVVAGLTAFYMFRLMGLTFWGAFRGPKAVWDKIHESPPVDDHPADPAGDPVDLPRACSSGCRSARAGSASWLEPIFAEGEADPPRRRRRAGLQPVRHRRRADPRQRRRSRPSAWSSPGGCSASSSGRSGMPARPERVRELTARVAVPLPSVAQQVVVRRPQPPAVHGHRRPDRGRLLVVRSRGRRRHGQRHRRRRRSTPAAGSARSRPAGSRTTRWASPSGSS